MKTIFLSLETIGFPNAPRGKYPHFSDKRSYDAARIVQIAWIVFDHQILQDNCFLIKPDGFKICNSHIHGITQENAEANGFDISVALKFFLEDAKYCKLFVCHNADFDLSILKNELFRAKLSTGRIEMTDSYCTMKTAVMGNRRWKTLTDQYQQLFNEVFPAHHALEDAYACLRCYFQLREKQDVKPHILLARSELKSFSI